MNGVVVMTYMLTCENSPIHTIISILSVFIHQNIIIIISWCISDLLSDLFALLRVACKCKCNFQFKWIEDMCKFALTS